MVDGPVDIAVVVVSYRSAALTIDCLESLAAERERAPARFAIRCVVVDNASGDAPSIAAAIASRGWSAWATVLIAERNGGFAYGNNLGIRHAHAIGAPDYVHLLNPDTLLLPGAIEALVGFFERHAEAGIAGGVFENGDRSEWAIAFRFPTVLGEFVQGLGIGLVSRLFPRTVVPMQMGQLAQPVDWVSGASLMLTRALLEAIGGMDERFFLYFEETEFCHRAKRAGFSVWYVPESRVVHIAGQSTKVTERNVAPKRLPGYWFASRRLYFVATHGSVYAMAADLAALAGHGLGAVKRFAQRRPLSAAPRFVRDLFGQSALWARNRGGERRGIVPRF